MSTTDFKTVEQTVLDKVENETEFSRSAIESMPNQIKLVDSDNGLDLFCYISYNPNQVFAVYCIYLCNTYTFDTL